MHYKQFLRVKQPAKAALVFVALLIMYDSLASASDPRLLNFQARQDDIESANVDVENPGSASTGVISFPIADATESITGLTSAAEDLNSGMLLSSSKASQPSLQSAANPGPNMGSSTVKTVASPNPGSTTEAHAPLDPRLPASRLSILKPKPNQATPPLFPIGGIVVFEWSLDNTTLVFPPSNLTVEATLSSDSTQVWPIANVSGSTTSVSWDTSDSQSSLLFMGFYILNIYEPKTGKRGVAASGHLIPSSDLRFGLYVPGANNIPKTDEKYCATCRFVSSGSSRLVRSIPWATGMAVLALVLSGTGYE